MAHMAKLDENNIVVAVLVARDEDEDREAALSARTGDTYKRTSYNTRGGQHPEGRPLRKNYAGIGYTYDAQRDAFIAPQPFASWLLDEQTCSWNPPTPMPTDGKLYRWDEETTSWKEVEQ